MMPAASISPASFADRSAPIAPQRGTSTLDARSPFAARVGAQMQPDTPKDQARQAVNKLIASAFIVPALQSLRDSSLAAEGPFSPNMAQRRFGPMLDQKIADEIVQGANFNLTDSIIRQYEQLAAGQNAQMPQAAQGKHATAVMSQVDVKG